MNSDNKCIIVLYGSQTGNAESIAKDMHSQLRNVHSQVDVQCLPLNKFKGFVKKESVQYLLLLTVSTTGNGDSPENCDAWWRSVKLRSAAKDLFANMSYSVLGLGDTNYDKFCFMGKSIDKRLGELGAERLLPLECADEATNLEETVERWKESVYQLVKAFLAKAVPVAAPSVIVDTNIDDNNGTSAVASTATASAPATSNNTKEAAKSALAVVDVANNTDTNVIDNTTTAVINVTAADAADIVSAADAKRIVVPDYAALLQKRSESVPEGLTSLLHVAKVVGMTETAFETLVTSHVIPAARDKHDISSAELLSEAEATASESLKNKKEASSFGLGASAEKAFQAQVTDAKWLTDRDMSLQLFDEPADQWGQGKRVVSLDVSLAGADIEYEPGDALGVCCPNAPYAVHIVLQRLQETHGPALTLDTLLRYQNSSNKDGDVISLRELLSERLDLCGLPKKTQLSQLAKCCQDGSEEKMLSLLAGREPAKKLLFTKFVEEQALNIAEVLHLFRSCRPNLSQLVQLAVPISPRYYSLASSPLAQGEIASFAFSLVRYTCRIKPSEDTSYLAQPDSVSVLRNGLCTSYLERICAAFLYPTNGNNNNADNSLNSDNTVKIKLFHKSTPHFHLPSSLATPLILVGPGTGVAPFVGFLQHRQMQRLDREQRLHPCHSSCDKLLDLQHMDIASSSGSSSSDKERKDGQDKISTNNITNSISNIDSDKNISTAAAIAADIHANTSPNILSLAQRKHQTHQQRITQKRRILAVSELMSEGVWRGGFELDGEDLPCEGNGVETFLDRVPCGNISLFFGCRDTRDFLFRDVLHYMRDTEVLSHLHVALSRVSSTPENSNNTNNDASNHANPNSTSNTGKKVYVTHLLEAQAAYVAQLMMKENAAFYICGDGNAMAKDVLAVLARILVSQGFCEDDNAAQQMLQTLKARKRLNLDIWS